MNALLETLGWWAIDFHLTAAIVLIVACAVLVALRQLAQRIALAWATSGGLLFLAILTALPCWPKTSWQVSVFQLDRPTETTRFDRTEASHFATTSSSDDVRLWDEPVEQRSELVAAPVEIEVAAIAPPTSSARTAANQAPARQVNLPAVFGSLFIATATLSGAWLLVGTLQVSRLRRRARRAPPELLELLGRIIGGAGPAPILLVSGDVNQPLATGVVRPAIVLPERMVAGEPVSHLAAALAHEWAHVRHGDLWLLALLRLLLPLLALEPLFWLWRRTVRQSQEELADAEAATQGDRIEYAEVLLSWARSSPERVPRGMAGSLALWERPSQLKRRVYRLLHGPVDLHCSHRLRFTITAAALAAVAILSLQSLRPTAVAQPALAAAIVDAPSDDDLVTVTGKVLDPRGKPLAGASVSALHWWHRFISYPPLAKTKCNSEGRFTIAFRKSQYAIGLGPADNWKEAMFVASANGFGLAWIRWREIPTGRELTLQLVDDVPITGRVVDLEGRPVVGVEVKAGAMYAPKDGDLDAWLEAVHRGEAELSSMRLLDGPPLYVDTWSPRPALTDRDGRFRISGLGRDRIVDLSFSGPAIAYAQARAVTRLYKALEQRLNQFHSMTVYGADLQMVAAPTQPIEGIVRDAEGGAPLAGVRIASWILAGRGYVPHHVLGTTTDSSGYYHLSGMPKGKGNEIMAIPNDDQPYLMRTIQVPEQQGLKPVKADIDLHRGVWITGRVTDKATEKGVLAEMFYWPFRSNEFARKLPEFESPQTSYGFYERYATRSDGTYRLVGLPGRGIVGAKSKLNRYRMGVGAEEIAGANEFGDFDTYLCPSGASKRFIHAMKEVDPPPDAETSDCDLALDPGGTITVKVVDPDGQPLSGFEADGKSATWRGFGAAVQSHSFDIVELGPDETRTVVIRHQQRKLTKAVNVRLADHPTGAMTVALEPAAKIFGRVVDQNGAAVPGASVTLHWYGSDGGSIGTVGITATDDRGRFEYTDVPSGCVYNVQTAVSGNNRIYLKDVQKLAPGEAKDLGEIKVDRVVKVDVKAAAEPVPAVRLVDSDGQPVHGAWVGVGAYGDSEQTPVWSPYSQKGVAEGGGRSELVGRSLPEGRVVLYARHDGRNLAALQGFSRAELLDGPDMVLQPACRVHGALASEGLVKAGRTLDWTNVYLHWHDDRPLSFSSKQQRFEFYLPPGKYRLSAYGTDTLTVEREIEVTAGQDEIDVGTIDLGATRLATLVGKPAPELREIKEWKNGRGVTLAELRGKYVLLDFWGHWCGPCIRGMPHLMKLHDAFADRGLVVIAVHDASVESIAEMDGKLNEKYSWGAVRELEWWGRELPFPVALDGGTPPSGVERKHWHGATTETYGINMFPTTLLIDREGNIVKQVHANDARLPEKLAQLLGVAGKPPTWRRRFDQVYQFAPGEVLRYVPTPFIPERTNFITERNSVAGSGRWPERFTLESDGAAVSPGPHGDDSLMALLASLAGWGKPGDTFDCSDELARRKIPGDWIVARDAPLTKRLEALEDILRKELRLPLRIEHKRVEREVIVVSGRYQFVPWRPEDKHIHLSTGDRDLDDVCGGGTGTFSEWLDTMSYLTGTRYIAETNEPPDGKLQWLQHPSTMSLQEASSSETDRLLANLSRQTSLKFERQRRPVDVWSVREEK